MKWYQQPIVSTGNYHKKVSARLINTCLVHCFRINLGFVRCTARWSGDCEYENNDKQCQDIRSVNLPVYHSFSSLSWFSSRRAIIMVLRDVRRDGEAIVSMKIMINDAKIPEG